MADRIFAGILFLVAIGYTIIAFTVIKSGSPGPTPTP